VNDMGGRYLVVFHNESGEVAMAVVDADVREEAIVRARTKVTGGDEFSDDDVVVCDPVSSLTDGWTYE